MIARIPSIALSSVQGIAEQDALAHDSEGVIADRTREHLTATDVAIVRFRRLILNEAKALVAGKESAAASRPEAYRLCGGGAHTSARLSFEDMMRERFGSTTGEFSEQSLSAAPAQKLRRLDNEFRTDREN